MPLTTQQIKEKLEAILAKQYADGEERQNRESSVWGGTGGDVKRAVAYASDAIQTPYTDETPTQFLERMISAIEVEQVRYKGIEDDQDGYGRATFNEILRDAKALR